MLTYINFNLDEPIESGFRQVHVKVNIGENRLYIVQESVSWFVKVCAVFEELQVWPHLFIWIGADEANEGQEEEHLGI